MAVRKYIQTYHEHFGLVIGADTVWDELEFIINRKLKVAVNIHHVEHGANKHDSIGNLMALSYTNHNKAHNEEYNRHYLQDVHNKFLRENPY